MLWAVVAYISSYPTNTAAQTISGIINDYAHVIAFDTCMNSATVTSNAAFYIGEEVLLIQMRGAMIDTTNTPTYGSILSLGKTGLYEIATIASLPDPQTIVFQNKMIHRYDTQTGLAQIVSIPKYTDVTVDDTLQARSWSAPYGADPGTGGVLALDVSGTLTISGVLDASGRGFLGGHKGLPSSTSIQDYVVNVQNCYCAGYKGEGIASSQILEDVLGGRGAPANGGGGGDSHNSGGGGGGNGGAGGNGGHETNESPYRGLDNGGFGGQALPMDPQRIFMGGGGGGGDENDASPGDGGYGGGIILIRAQTVVSNNGIVRANGENGNHSLIDTVDGAGGGGAGGTIIFDVNNTIGKISLQARGGNGGSVDAQNAPYAFGPGGGGGGGLISPGTGLSSISLDLRGGDSGIVTGSTDASVNNTSYHAQRGGTGSSSYPVSIPESKLPFLPLAVTLHSLTICPGEKTTIAATFGADSYLWSPSTGMTDPTRATETVSPSTSTTYTVVMTKGQCVISDTVQVLVLPKPNAVFTGADNVCLGSIETYRIIREPFTTYAWTNTGGPSTSTADTEYTITWSTPGTQTITLIAQGGCMQTFTMTVTVGGSVTPSIQGTLSICQGDSTTLSTATAYQSYLWHPNGETTPSITVSKAGTYSVDVTTASGCSGSNTATVIVNPTPPKPSITRSGTTLTSSPATAYEWSEDGTPIPNSNNASITISSDGDYTVKIWDANGCTNTSDPFHYLSNGAATVAVAAVTKGEPNSNVVIPLELVSANNLVENGATSYVAKIRLDGSQLVPTSAAAVHFGNDWLVTLSGPVTDLIGQIDSLALQTTDSGYCSDITIDTFYFPNAQIKVTTVNGRFCLSGLCRPWMGQSDTAFLIKRIAPNPAGNNFSISYHIASDSPVSIELQDDLGRTVDILKHTWSPSGNFVEQYSLSQVASGLYHLVLRSGNRSLSQIVRIEK